MSTPLERTFFAPSAAYTEWASAVRSTAVVHAVADADKTAARKLHRQQVLAWLLVVGASSNRDPARCVVPKLPETAFALVAQALGSNFTGIPLTALLTKALAQAAKQRLWDSFVGRLQREVEVEIAAKASRALCQLKVTRQGYDGEVVICGFPDGVTLEDCVAYFRKNGFAVRSLVPEDKKGTGAEAVGFELEW